MAVKQRREQADYLDIGTKDSEQIEFMGTGFVDMNESPGAQEREKRYINDASTSTSVTSYKPEYGFNADLIVSEPTIKHIYEIGKYRKTGDDVLAAKYSVDLDEPISGEDGVYNARKEMVSIIVNSYGSEDGEMTIDGSFKAVGDVVKGKFDTASKTFTAETDGVEVTP